ncbi:MAG: glycosyltransferase [Bacteroidales bacterium]|nr:glycosyltransferase [Bacteroidales bacterium]
MKRLSIIIVTYNSEKDIFDCLKAVFKHNDLGDELEVIVVDNASAGFETMRKEIEDVYDEKIVVVSNSKNGGYGQGNNVGIRLSSSDKFLIMNPDVRIIMPMFSKIVETLNDGNVALCGFTSMENESLRNSSFYYTRTTSAFRKVFFRKKLQTDDFQYKRMFLSGACFAMNKDVFEKIGMFDENIFLYGEENDIHFRLRKMFPEKKMVFLKELRYVHPTANERDKGKEYRHSMKSAAYFYKKNQMPMKSLYRNEMNQMIFKALALCIGHPSRIREAIERFREQKNLVEMTFNEINGR